MGCVYKLTFPSGKSYIGITIQRLMDRLRAHRGAASIGRGGHLYNAMRKYGLRSFTSEVLIESDDFDELKRMERIKIIELKTKSPNGYNLSDGGDGAPGVRLTPEQREKRSISQRKSFADPARRERHAVAQRTPEARSIKSINAKRRWSTDEAKSELSQRMKAMWRDPVFLGKMVNRPHKPTINDGLTNVERYRLKDLEAYRKRKREWAKTPIEREKRLVYMRQWRADHRESYNKACRERRASRLAKQTP